MAHASPGLIPESQRNAFERDFAKSVGVLDGLVTMSGATKEGAVKIGQLFLFAHHLTSGWMTVHAMLMSRIWQAARHVERLAGARFAFVEVPASGLGAPANTRRVTEVDCEEAVARWMRTGNGPFTAMKPHQEAVDPQLYMHMSADEFVLVLCALYCSNRGNKPVAFKLATNLLSSAAVQTRIREVLVPRVAARGAGQTWKMSAEQLESVWLTESMLGLLEGVAEGAVPAGSDAAVQARKVWVAAGVRMEELQPHCGPLVLSVSIRAATGAGDTATVCRLSALMARLGDEAGNDLAAATGHYATISNILSGKALGTSGAGGRNPYPLCELRAMLAKANAAERRLARWNMGTVIVDNVSTQMLTTLRDSMAELAHLPDTAEIHLPYKLGRGNAPAAPARPASGAAVTAAAAAEAGAQSSTCEASSASAPAASCSQAEGASAIAAPAAVGNKACHGCGKAVPRLQKCSRCRQRWYCSEACQVKDWRAGHKVECKRLAAEAEAAAQ